MEINTVNLKNARTSFMTIYDNAFLGHKNTYNVIAEKVTSTTSQNVYRTFGKLSGMKRWLGERVLQDLSDSKFAIENNDYENTVVVGRNDFEDDQLGSYSFAFKDLGQTTKEWPDDLCWDLLKAARSTICYDKQFFIDTDHPVLDVNGHEISVSNDQGGTGLAWYLVDDSRAIKPIIFQERKAPKFVGKDNPQDERVFMNNEFVYGVDSRGNTGFGLWQMIQGSRKELNAQTFMETLVALMEMKGDHGRPLKLKPKKLIVPPALMGAANEVIKAERLANGATNTLRNVVEIHVEPALAE